ncbi:MAG: hypothetical protein NWE86_02030 [Candidatus Bathyarchaeota archaeon]|jgi:phenylpyruvate tautomerase PptA (4-oxalocrotonate tautomerase family)|nr:hypothetical protein [Candidatus Bathyarchaeota archaeon]
MPFVEITTGTDFLTSEQKIKLNKAITESMLRVFQEEKGIKPHISIVIRSPT